MNPQEQLFAKIKSVETLVESYKETIESYLADTTYPLEERWLVYKKLPPLLRNHESSQEDFLFTDEENCVEICTFRDYNRYEVINVNEFFEDWDYDIRDYNKKHPDAPIDLNISKEKVLEMNLGSFINDW